MCLDKKGKLLAVPAVVMAVMRAVMTAVMRAVMRLFPVVDQVLPKPWLFQGL